MVIVAVAFIGILVSTLMWVTMSNFFMKTTDAKYVRIKGFADRDAIAVSIDGTSLGSVRFDRSGVATVALPAEMKSPATITLGAEQGRQTPRISEIRLCK